MLKVLPGTSALELMHILSSELDVMHINYLIKFRSLFISANAKFHPKFIMSKIGKTSSKPNVILKITKIYRKNANLVKKSKIKMSMKILNLVLQENLRNFCILETSLSTNFSDSSNNDPKLSKLYSFEKSCSRVEWLEKSATCHQQLLLHNPNIRLVGS